MPQREQYLWVCENQRPAGHPKGCCADGGAVQIREALKKGLAERGLHARVRVCGSSCLDLCESGPTIAVMPQKVFYGRVTAHDVPEILDSLEAGTLVNRLLQPQD